jgi:hypothetical protein
MVGLQSQHRIWPTSLGVDPIFFVKIHVPKKIVRVGLGDILLLLGDSLEPRYGFRQGVRRFDVVVLEFDFSKSEASKE